MNNSTPKHKIADFEIAHNIVRIPIRLLEPNDGQLADRGLPTNPNEISEDKYEDLKESIINHPEFLIYNHLKVYPLEGGHYIVLGGNQRLRACKELGYDAIPATIYPEETPMEDLRASVILDNARFGHWNWDLLANDWEKEDLHDWGVDMPFFGDVTPAGEINPPDPAKAAEQAEKEAEANASLAERFLIPPFSVLDARKGYWQKRKKAWAAKIGDVGQSRDGALKMSLSMRYPKLFRESTAERERLGISFADYLEKYVSAEEKAKYDESASRAGVSIFDAALAEVILRWFGLEGGSVFDCFAGDSAVGLIAGTLGLRFTGIELRPEQAALNNERVAGLSASYICDDGQNVAQHLAPESQDLFFSCPPYFDLEVYSDLPNDASNQGSYEDFIKILENAFTAALGCLKPNRFAVIVVGDVRDKRTGFYYDFIGDIKRIFKAGGAPLYNELILVDSVGNAALRAAKYMESRKVAKTHQNVLVFFKGDPKQIKSIYPTIDYASEELEAFGAEDENN